METKSQPRAEYEHAICSRRAAAVPVPFVEVNAGAWSPEVAECHANVDRWVAENPEYEAVRGWITYQDFLPCGVRLTAHSVVRDPNGNLFDITPVFEGQPRGGPFIEHPGDGDSFSDMRQPDICCPSLDPAADAEALRALLALYPNPKTYDDEEHWL